jgi:cytochrome c
MRAVSFFAALAFVGAGEARAQDAGAGEKVFGVCKACHQIGENAKNAVGPVLNGVIGRMAGNVAGYSYSDANKNSGITWDEATFREYIKDPKAKVPGTKMIYAGLKDEQKTNDLVAFLKQFGENGDKIRMDLLDCRRVKKWSLVAKARDLGNSLLTRDTMNSRTEHPKVSDGNSEPHQLRDSDATPRQPAA